MAWFRVEGKVAFHRKMVKAGNSAVGAWTRMGAWCADNRTDGRIPRGMADAIGSSNDIRMLLLCGLVSEDGTDIVIHDYLVYNMSADQDDEIRAKKSKAGSLGAKVRWSKKWGHDASIGERHGSRHSKRNSKTIADPDPDLLLQQQRQQQELPAQHTHNQPQLKQPPSDDYIDPRVPELAAALRRYTKLTAATGNPERYVESHVLNLLDQHPRFTIAHATQAFYEADHDTPEAGEPPAHTLKRLRSYLDGKVKLAEASAHRRDMGQPEPPPQQRILPESHRHLKPPPRIPPPMIPLPPVDPNITLEEMRDKLSNRMVGLFESKPELPVRKAAPPDGEPTPTLPFPEVNESDDQEASADEPLTATEA